MADQNDFADQILTLGINDIGDSYALAFTATYICGGKTFQILVAGDPPPGYDTQSTEVAWTEELLDLSMHDGTDAAQCIAQDIFLQKLAHDIRRIALPKMLELAPLAPGSPPPRDPRRGVHTVYEHLCPDMVKLQLVSRDGCFELVEGHHCQLPTDELKPITQNELEKLGVKDIELLPTHAASEVLLLSQCQAGMSAYYATDLGRTEEWVCKLSYRWCQEATFRELGILAKIQKARLNLGPALRVTTLKALVTYEDSVVGLLIDKIPTRYPSLEGVVRGSLKVPLSLRRKWAAQIEDTVRELHCLGIIWGDAKPGNVVIDECDDAWLIDFGGGFTQHWVDSEFAESVEGDLQAVDRIRKRLVED